MTRSRWAAPLAAIAILGASLSACSSGGSGSGTAPVLSVAAYSSPTLQANFNPLSPNALRGTTGLIYEQLFDFNTADKNQFMPGLATKFAWGAAGRSMDITLDKRAKWSDGSALTPADVAFTLTYMRQHDLLEFPLSTATATADGVRLTFSSPAYAAAQYIGRVAIVPEKVWKTKDPETDTNTQPMGSGPYSLGRVTGQQVSFMARKDYWRQSVPVPQINYVTTSSATLLAQEMVRHDVDLAYGGIPDVKQAFVAKDPEHNHLWPVLQSVQPILLNTRRHPFDNVHVRKGISLSLDRVTVANAYNPGVYQAAWPTGLYKGAHLSWIPAALRKPAAQDKAAALAEFAKAGYRPVNGKLVGSDGKPLTMPVMTVGSFADAMAYDREIVAQLSAVGINATVQGLPPSGYTSAESKHDFDAIYGDAFVFGENPYTYYYSMLSPDSALSVVGWNDPDTNRALKTLAAAAPAQQEAATLTLQKIMVDKVPVVPLMVKGTPYMYSTLHWTGWPSAANPYTTPDPGTISGVFAEKMYLSLRPVS